MPAISFKILHDPENKEECYLTIQQYEQSALLFHNRRHLSRPSSTSTTTNTNTKIYTSTGKAWSYVLTWNYMEWHLPWSLWLHEHTELGSKRSVWQRVSKLENGDLEEVVTNFQEIKALSTCNSLISKASLYIGQILNMDCALWAKCANLTTEQLYPGRLKAFSCQFISCTLYNECDVLNDDLPMNIETL